MNCCLRPEDFECDIDLQNNTTLHNTIFFFEVVFGKPWVEEQKTLTLTFNFEGIKEDFGDQNCWQINCSREVANC